MKLDIFYRIRTSIFAKLTFVIIITGIFIQLLIHFYIAIILKPHRESVFLNNYVNYIHYIIRDIGVPPNRERAVHIARTYALRIRYEGPDGHWATSDRIPSIESLGHAFSRLNRNVKLYDKKPYILVSDHDYQILFGIEDLGNFFPIPLKYTIFLITLLTLILTGSFFTIRWVLQPVKLLNEGVYYLSKEDFTHQIRVKRKDELGVLSLSFNDMTKRIREMIHAREQLLLDVSHELRSPLTRTKVALELMPDDENKENIREDIDEMEAMITEILETERLNSKYGQLKPEPVRLADVIGDVINEYQNQAPGITFLPVAAVNLIYVPLDVKRIRIVLRNILNNAFKYSPTHGQPIRIEVQDDSRRVLVRVTDFGSGIPEADLPYIFEPFYRVDKSRSKKTGGYGLGMNISKKIVEAHGGTISINSKIGAGTTVTLQFMV